MGWWRETIDIVKENDPAARTTLEVLLTYPGVKAWRPTVSRIFSGSMASNYWLVCTVSFGASGLKLRFIQVPRLIQVSLSTTDLAW